MPPAAPFQRMAWMPRPATIVRTTSAEAERCCRELIEHDPRHFDALHLLGVVHLDRAQFADAITWLTRAFQQRPDDAQVNYHLGTAQLGLKLYDQAETTLRRALAARPDDAGTLNNLGNALAGNRKHAAAIECFQQVPAPRAGTRCVSLQHGPGTGGTRSPGGRGRELSSRLGRTRPSRPSLADWPISMPHWARRSSVWGATTKRAPNATRSQPPIPASQNGTRAWCCCYLANTKTVGRNTRGDGRSRTTIHPAPEPVCPRSPRSPASASC